jgi:hypothetical protein
MAAEPFLSLVMFTCSGRECFYFSIACRAVQVSGNLLYRNISQYIEELSVAEIVTMLAKLFN